VDTFATRFDLKGSGHFAKALAVQLDAGAMNWDETTCSGQFPTCDVSLPTAAGNDGKGEDPTQIYSTDYANGYMMLLALQSYTNMGATIAQNALQAELNVYGNVDQLIQSFSLDPSSFQNNKYDPTSTITT
jgi:hypothetical protein